MKWEQARAALKTLAREIDLLRAAAPAAKTNSSGQTTGKTNFITKVADEESG